MILSLLVPISAKTLLKGIDFFREHGTVYRLNGYSTLLINGKTIFRPQFNSNNN
ncbi:MAG: hypothetical protein ACI8SC_002353 [Colwellia sp.]|jgi:hypothetical protein